MKKALLVTIAAAVLSVLVLLTYLYVTRVREVDRDPATFWRQKDIKEIPIDPQLSRMISRAQVDFILFPTNVGSRRLKFQTAAQSKEQIYLVLRPEGSSHTAIVYAYGLTDHRPLWKAQIALD